MNHFAERLQRAIERTGTSACVGLDPRPGSFPESLRPEIGASRRQVADCIRRWAMAVLAACEGEVPVVKPQAACFEAWGPQGMEVFADVCGAAHARGFLVIGDVKRGDIGSSAELYARAYLDEDSAYSCDAITVSPYLGMDSLAPFFDLAQANGRGVFVLCRTSNARSGDFQASEQAGEALYERVARLVEERAARSLAPNGLSNLGLVVGATFPEATVRARELAPHCWQLLPGYGHQGGKATDLAGACDAGGGGILVSSSRGITEAWQDGPESFEDSILRAVRAMKADLVALSPRGK